MRTYTEEDLATIMALAAARADMDAVAKAAHDTETEARIARGYIEDKATRDRLLELAEAALRITLEADRIAADLAEIRREVQA